MTAMTDSSPATTETNIRVVEQFFAAVARKDLDAVRGLFSEDATWTHLNRDRFYGVDRGPEAIVAYIGTSVQLTGGTLRPVPLAMMSDGEHQVAVVVQLTGERPDGRRSDSRQVVLYTVEDGKIQAVQQFFGDPAAVTAFWD